MRQPPGTRFSRRTPATPQRLGANPRLPLFVLGGGGVLLLLLWILFLPPVSLLRGGDGWQDAGEDSLVRPRADVPKPPAGFQLASPFYEIRSRQDRGIGPATMTVPLGDGKGGRGLRLYTYADGSWKPLGPAEVTSDGKAARGQVDQVPENVAVMRRTSAGFQIQGILPAGVGPHPDAEKLINVRSPADYVPVADGSVAGDPSPRPNDDSVALVPVVRATAGVEKDAVNAILGSEQTRDAHLDGLVKLVQVNRLDGLDIEYPAIEPGLSGSFQAFVAALADRLHKTGQTLTVTLPLPRREAGSNWNTFGYDWKELSKSADFLRIEPERDQSIYRRSVRDALNYISGLTDPKKVILTLSPLAAERSEQGIRTLSALEALSIAAQFTIPDRDRLTANSDVQVTAMNLNREGSGQAGLIWDANAAAVSFVYQSADALRTVWIENVFSAAFKLEFIQLWGLGGLAVDDASAGEGMANIWPAIDQYRASGQPTLLQPNGQLLRPQWLVDGQSKEVGKASFTWKTPPDPSDHRISLIIGDGMMRVISSTQVTLRAGPPIPASPTPVRSPTPTPTR